MEYSVVHLYTSLEFMKDDSYATNHTYRFIFSRRPAGRIMVS